MFSKIKLKHIHIALIIFGSIFLLLPLFHNLLWFDEAYSVSLASHSFKDIWVIGGHDVHPVLYYFFLHLIYLIAGSNSIICYRIFSWLCYVILGILGMTHIRKDFGEKTGIIFTFLVYFLPIASLYTSEIRMYSFGLLIASLMLIYAYRVYKNDGGKSIYKFALFSLMLAYTHYYGLMLAGVCNIALFIYLIRSKRYDMLKKFIILAVTQIILYIPWIPYFITQLTSVGGGFWITIAFPRTLYEVVGAQFQTNIESWITFIIALLLYLYTIYLLIKNKEIRTISLVSAFIYLIIVLVTLLISLIASPILYARYLIIISGLIIFYLSYTLSTGNKYIVVPILILIFLLGTQNMNANINNAYDEHNYDHITYLYENLGDDDIILYDDMSGSAITTLLGQYKDNKSYFYNKDHWGIDIAYKAFEPHMYVLNDLEFIEQYKGRIWIIESDKTELKDTLKELYNVEEISTKDFYQKYKELPYKIELIEKN